MGMIEALKQFLTLEPLQVRTVDPYTAAPDLTTQIANLRVNQALARPWRLPSIDETLGVPAILRAVTLISNTVGSLSIQGFRDEMPMDESPRIITRPDPFRTPQECYRDMAWAMATRGEAVLWIAARDSNETPLSLIVVPLAELTVEDNPRNRLFPIYEWGREKSTRYSPANPTGDFVHITFAKLTSLALRGVGPLQLCGAASSVSVEAQEWAANFFASGGYPSIELHSEVDLDEVEAANLKRQWIETPPNMPKVTNPELTTKEFGVNPQGAQMMESREYQNGDAARMFGIPGSLLDYSTPGSSLTYQNLEGEFGKFVRGCLAPNYLAPIEQALSDLLPRAVVARFYVDGLLRADIKTRYEVYASGITSGVLTVDEARTKEGMAPGNVELASVPPAMPAATPGRIPDTRSAMEVRCDGRMVKRRSGVPSVETCHRLLTRGEPFVGKCPRCGKVYEAPPPPASEMELAYRSQAESIAAFMARPPATPVVNNYVTVPEREFHAGDVTVNTPEVRVDVNPTPIEVRNEVTVEPTPVEVKNEVTVEPTPIEVRNLVDVSPTPIEVTTGDVHVRAEMPASMTVDIKSMPKQKVEITALPPQKKRVTERDSQGRIVEVAEETA